MTTPDFDALEKEMAELNEIKKTWDKAFDRVFEILQIVAKHETEFYEWQKKKQTLPEKECEAGERGKGE